MQKKISKLPFKGTPEQEAELKAFIAEHCNDESNVMTVMQKAQDIYGYLPIEPTERGKKLKALEQRAAIEHQTQLFIETPYRNNKMVEDILKNCRPQTRLCIAANITCEDEYIKTKTLKEWKGHVPDLSKIPCIFLLYV